MLRATRPILYNNRQYWPGEALPEYDTRMVEAWVRAGSASREAGSPPTPAARPDGVPGRRVRSSDGDPDAILRKVPDREDYKTETPAQHKRRTTKSK